MKHKLLFAFGILTMLIIGTGSVTPVTAQSLKYSPEFNRTRLNWVLYEAIPIDESHDSSLNIERRNAIAQCEMEKLENSWDSSKISSSCISYPDITLEQRNAIAQCEMEKLENSWDSSKMSLSCVG